MNNKFDLEERTNNVGKEAILLCKRIHINPINSPLINQYIRSVTSIGANYHEASESTSKKDFVFKLAIAKKEAKESLHWLKLLNISDPDFSRDFESQSAEIRQLVLIFSASINTALKRS